MELEPIIEVPDLNGNPEDACGVLFYGDYRYCGEVGPGLVQCCIGDFR